MIHAQWLPYDTVGDGARVPYAAAADDLFLDVAVATAPGHETAPASRRFLF